MLGESEENRALDAMYGEEQVPNLHEQAGRWIDVLTDMQFHLNPNATEDMAQGDEDVVCMFEMLRDDSMIGMYLKWEWEKFIHEGEKTSDAAAKRRAKCTSPKR